MSTMVQCLELIASNAGIRNLTVKGHAVLAAHIRKALKEGYVEYTPGRPSAYKLTARGKVFLSSARTGIPMPSRR